MTVATLSRGDLLRALAVVVIWGLNFVVMKFGLQGLSPMLLGALRFTAASLPFLLFVPRPSLPWRFVVGYGLAQGLGQFGFLFLGLQLGMTAGMASVVMQTQAFFTLLLAAPLLGERAKPWQWGGLLLAFGGLMTIGLAHGEGPGEMTLAGFVLTLGAAFMWAVSNMVVRRAAQSGAYAPFSFIVWSSVVPIVPFFALAVWTEGASGVVAQLQSIDGTALLAVLYLALLATLLAYTLWTQLLQRHSAGRGHAVFAAGACGGVVGRPCVFGRDACSRAMGGRGGGVVWPGGQPDRGLAGGALAAQSEDKSDGSLESSTGAGWVYTLRHQSKEAGCLRT